MSTVFDRLKGELDQLGDRMQSALEQGRLHIEKTGVQGRRSDAARELGLLAWQKARGEAVDETRYDALIARLNELQEELSRIERAMAAARAEDVSVGEDPPPGAETAEAEVTAEPAPGPDPGSRSSPGVSPGA